MDWKPPAQVLGAVLAVVLPVLMASDTPLSYTEWVNVGVLAAGAITVWITQNNPQGGPWNYARLGATTVSTAGVVIISATSDGWPLTNVEWLQVIAAVAGSLAVYEAPVTTTVGRHSAAGLANPKAA